MTECERGSITLLVDKLSGPPLSVLCSFISHACVLQTNAMLTLGFSPLDLI